MRPFSVKQMVDFCHRKMYWNRATLTQMIEVYWPHRANPQTKPTPQSMDFVACSFCGARRRYELIDSHWATARHPRDTVHEDRFDPLIDPKRKHSKLLLYKNE